ncbi:MAG: type II toxin-antitoxin system Phd/YefM family antitoxin [Eubacteriaceae bacterium]|jgi:antitoxin Phd|nr:type II toxin-antitoxin system Phd/YefM family antitoxin [Eubacteriaceae bacterium]
MLVRTDNLVSISEANQNFSRVAKSVDENGAVVILKNNAPKYILFNFDEFVALDNKSEDITEIAKKILKENKEAFERLAQ